MKVMVFQIGLHWCLIQTYRIKRVYKIENKSFYFGILRWKLNPYIHRIFGKII